MGSTKSFIHCSLCGHTARLVKGVHSNYYSCNRCYARAGCDHSGNLRGTFADSLTRFARQEAHKVFDTIWKKKLMTRDQAYSWLAESMKMDKDECHISMFTKDQCYEVISLSQDYLKPGRSNLYRRKR